MPRPALGTLAVSLVFLYGCAESTYDQLAQYKNEATPADALLQECLDTYAGRRIRIGEGYGYRLPFESGEVQRLLKRVREATEELRGIEPPDAALDLARDKIAAAESVCDAFEALDDVTRGWEEILPTGVPSPDDTDLGELSPEEVERWRADMARVNRTFERAEAALNDAALALGAAILRTHDEK